MKKNSAPPTVVVGGGAAGLFCACQLSAGGVPVLLIEKNAQLGRKLRITGKGRCNLTNDCDSETFLKNVPRNWRFLYSAINAFSTQDTKDYFTALGVPLKTERGARVFPVSDSAHQVADALVQTARAQGVTILQDRVTAIAPADGGYRVETAASGDFFAPQVVVATGGLSYPQTGSDGDGHRFAAALDLPVTACSPSLIPMVVKEPWCKNLMGLSLRNATLTVRDTQKKDRPVFSQLGELLFTHFGVSGPLVLSASGHMEDVPGRYRLQIDLKPGLTAQQLDRRILRDVEENPNKNFSNLLAGLLPQKLIGTVCALSGVPATEKANQLTRAQRAALRDLLKCLPLTFAGFRPIAEAIITRGGVDVRQVQPGSMQIKERPGLYFVGEVLDVDGYTGGFNLQIAFSTAYLAARDILAKRGIGGL